MEKRQLNRLIFFSVVLMFISLVSAQFSLTEFFNNISAGVMILTILFLIIFIFLNWILTKRVSLFEGSPVSAGIVSVLISLLAVYGMGRTSFDFEGFFYNIGFSPGLLWTILPLVFLGLLIVVLVKFKHWTFLSLGALLVVLSFTELIYEKGIVLVAGIILLVIGIIWLIRRRRKGKRSWLKFSGPDWVGRKEAGARRAQEEQGIRNKLADEKERRDARKQRRKERKEARKQKRDDRRRSKSRELAPQENLQDLIRQYNEIQRQNPRDPRLKELAQRIKELRKQKKR